jgi:hypothetical protein
VDVITPTYYDGAVAPERAVAVTVRGGGQTVVDFSIANVPTFTVSGSLRNSLSGVSMQIQSFYAVPRNPNAIRGDLAAFPNKIISERISPGQEGAFRLEGLMPGSYDLYPSVRGNDLNLYTTRLPIDVLDRNVDRLTGSIAPNLELRGRVVLNGVGLSIPSDFGLALRTRSGGPASLLRSSAATVESGKFVLTDIFPGSYSLIHSALPEGLYISDLRQNDRSVFETGTIIVDGKTNDLEIVIGGNPGRVEGVVFDQSGQVQPNAIITLIPEIGRRENIDLYRRTMSDEAGRFRVPNVGPGNYKVFAWREDPSGAQVNAAFMAQYEQRGIAVTVESRGANIIELRIVEAPR